MTPAALRKLAFRFREARALFAGIELGVFGALADGPRTAPEIAAKLGLDPRGSAILLDALRALGALTREDERYTVPPSLQSALLPGGADYAGNLLLHDLWHWTSWGRLDSAVREGAAWTQRAGDPHLGNPDVLKKFLPNYVLAMEQSEDGASQKLAQRLAALRPRRVLDLGGGSGALLIRLVEALPRAHGTLVEHAFSLSRALSRVDPSPARERIALLASDFEKEEIPRDHDLIVLSRVLMGMAPERAQTLLRRVADSMPSGGALAVHDFDSTTRVGALLSLDMLLNTGGGVHARAELEGWLAGVGLALESTRRLLPYTRLWIARKPAR